MQDIIIFQIIDCLGESIFHTFIGPNVKFATKQFVQFLTSSKFANSIDPADFVLVAHSSCHIFDSFSDYVEFDKFDTGLSEHRLVIRGDKAIEAVKDGVVDEG